MNTNRDSEVREALGRRYARSPGDLGRELGISPQAAGAALRRLQAAGQARRYGRSRSLWEATHPCPQCGRPAAGASDGERGSDLCPRCLIERRP